MPSKPAKPPKPTAAELDLLRVIWRLGPATVKDVHAARVRERPELTYATVLRLMQVMHGKGLLVRDESERSHVYAAAHAQGALQTNLLSELIPRPSPVPARNWCSPRSSGPRHRQGARRDQALPQGGAAMADLLATSCPLLGQALLHFLWQGALIGLLAALALRRVAQCAAAGALRRRLPGAAGLRAGADRDDAAACSRPTCWRPIPQRVRHVEPPTRAPCGGALPALAPATAQAARLPARDRRAWAAGTCLLSLRMALGLAWVRRLRTCRKVPRRLAWQARLDAMARALPAPARASRCAWSTTSSRRCRPAGGARWCCCRRACSRACRRN